MVVPTVTLPKKAPARRDYWLTRDEVARRLRLARKHGQTRHICRLLLVFCPGNSLTKSGEFLEDGVGGGGPHKGACIGVVSADEAVDFLDQIGG